MLHDAPVMISFSVDDEEEAKKFYSKVLGLEVDDSQGMLQVSMKGGATVMIYGKKTHKPASYTLLNFTVDDLSKSMKELEAKGVVFERYDDESCKTDEHGVADYGMMKIAFFNDPAGNNHAVLQMTNK